MSRVVYSEPTAPLGRSDLSELAETVAHVTFAMHEALATYDESALPGGYRYHLFSGFPGFCDYAAEAGLILHQTLQPFDIDQWLELIEDFATRVIHAACEKGSPAIRPAVTRHAEAVLGATAQAALRGAPSRSIDQTTGGHP